VGVAAHEALCCGEHRIGGLWERAFVVTRFVEDAIDGAAAVRSGRIDVLLDAAAMLGRLRAKGLRHGDARLANFLASPAGVVAIDLCQGGGRSAAPDLATLLGTACEAGANRAQLMAAAVAEFSARTGRAATQFDSTDAEVEWSLMLSEAERESQRRYGYKVIGAKGAHNALRRALDKLAPCKVLDAPAGEGILSEFLRLRGHDVHCADIDPGNFKLPHLKLTQVDLNKSLPFKDGEFDAVVCANALHRLYNPAGCVAEMARVLKPGGVFYMNVNNYATIEKRLRFLIYGSIDNQVNSSIAQQSTEAPEANLRVALHMPMICNAMERAGLKIESVKPSAMGPAHWILLPISILFRLLGYVVGPRSRGRNWLKHANGWGVLPGGKYVLVVARKAG